MSMMNKEISTKTPEHKFDSDTELMVQTATGIKYKGTIS